MVLYCISCLVILHTAVNAEEEAEKGIILWNESSENEIVVLFYEIFVVNYAIMYVMSSHTDTCQAVPT